jgi:cellulose synthase operon protein C
VWVAAAPGEGVAAASVVGGLEGTWREVAAGLQARLTLPAEARWLELASAGRRARLALAEPATGNPEPNLLDRARQAHTAGRLEEAVALARQAVARFEAAGKARSAADATAFLAFVLIQDSRLREARELLEAAPAPTGLPAEVAFWLDFHRLLLARRAGDFRAAFALAERLEQLGARAGLERDTWRALQVQAVVLRSLGRTAEAQALFTRLRAAVPAGVAAVERARLLNNEAWDRLLAREAGEAVEDPLPLLEAARAVYDGEGGRAASRANVRLNLALAQLQAGRWAEAAAVLAEVEGLRSQGLRFGPREEGWRLDLEARVALARGRYAEADALYRGLEAEAEGDARWRAWVGQARVARARGQPAPALAMLERAEAWVEQQSLAVPVHEGRESFAAQREASARLHVATLLALDRPAEAFAAARRARSRILRQLASRARWGELAAAERLRLEPYLERYQAIAAEAARSAANDWQLPSTARRRAREARNALEREALAALDSAYAAVAGPLAPTEPLVAPAPGELWLGYFPLEMAAGEARWVGFAVAADARGTSRVEARRLLLPAPEHRSPSALAAALLTPFAAPLARAGRLRVLVYGELRALDFHALPWQGSVLLAALPVAYGLDLGQRAPAPVEAARLLVVGDPRGDLPAAAREASAVRRSWPAGRPVTALEGDAATPEAVRAALASAEQLHFAGHGAFAGRGGWESELRLAGGARLSVGDLLALPRVPRRVVLSACEGGRAEPGAALEGLGLAQAFVVAGAAEVIAASRPVGDAETEAFVTDLYRELAAGSAPAAALRTAQLAWRARAPDADWASFRLFLP